MIDFPNCRVLIDPEANSGAWNMAVDQMLLQSALDRGVCTLRFYRWRKATLSLGYFQKGIPEDYTQKRSLDVVRRLSGGGAILHHHELTYSISLPPGHPISRNPRQLYQQVHRSVASCLQEHGMPVQLRGASQNLTHEPFLCFSRGDANDLIFGTHKVFGSAQRRRRGAVLQHGSLLLKRSEHAVQYPGLRDLFPETTLSEFPALELNQWLSPLLAVDFKAELLTAAELAEVKYLTDSQYGDVSCMPGRTSEVKRNDLE